jgi:multimeric flavodoxin WrbA
MASVARLLILWHSLTGGSRQMAQAAADGAGAECEVMLVPAREADAAHVLDVDGYLFVAPENLASLAGVMKDFFDRTYYPLLGRIEGRPYAAMICAGTDGEGAARQVARIATGWRLRAVAEPLIVRTGAQTPEAILAPKTIDALDLSRCRDLGATIAAGLSLGIF